MYLLERTRIPSGHTTLNGGIECPHTIWSHHFLSQRQGFATLWPHHFLNQRQGFAHDLVTPLSYPASRVRIPFGHTTFYASDNGSHTILLHTFLCQRQGFAYHWSHHFLSQRQESAYDLATPLSKPASRVCIRSGHTTFYASVKGSHTIWTHHFLSQRQGFAYDLVTSLCKPASRVRITSGHTTFYDSIKRTICRRSAYHLAAKLSSYGAVVTVTWLSSCGKFIIEVYPL